MAKKITKLNQIELRLYKSIGISHFKRFVLWFEQTKHRKDGLRNKNYHLANRSEFAAKKHCAFLLYNAIVHAASILLALIYFLSIWISGKQSIGLNAVMCIITAMNLYCIMLQRFVYLRLKNHSCKCRQKTARYVKDKCAIVKPEIQKCFSMQQIQSDAAFVVRTKACLLAEKNSFITDKDISTMERLLFLAEKANMLRNDAARCVSRNTIELQPLRCKIAGYTAAAAPYGKLEKRVDFLMTQILKKPHYSVIQNFGIVTESAACDALYKKLFSSDSLDSVLQALDVFEAAYLNVQLKD